MKSAFRFARNAGLPIVRQPRKEGDHDIMTPELKAWLAHPQPDNKHGE
jgi:hypothetical protein